jgi:ribosomal protein S18 acetylase RimI-like enzyme
MPLQPVTVTQADLRWHDAFLDFVPEVFPGIGFREWYEHGGWDERYRVFACVEGQRIVASASLMRMDLVLGGAPVRGWQLGAVGTLPDYRQRGLQREILTRLLAHTDLRDLVFLFANETVLEFYPRFGFERIREQRFGAEHRAAPQAEPLPSLSFESASDRALLRRIATQARPTTSLFGARDYGGVVLWYWANFHRRNLRYVAAADALMVACQRGDTLTLLDVLASRPIDVASYVPRLISAPITRLEFGFTPAELWSSATPIGAYTESPLFARGPHRLPDVPFKFPMLAQT